MNLLELAASLTGLANIALLTRRSIWNFPFAIVSVTCAGLVLRDARLYAEAGLQAFFVLANLWGWWLWLKSGPDERSAVAVGWMEPGQRLGWFAVTLALSASLGWLLHRFTNAALPFADSAVAGASIAAQILLALGRVENWIVWIGIDIVAIALYVSRGLPLLALLYAAFLVLSAIGLRDWARAARPC